MLVSTLSAVAIVPVEPDNPGKVDHIVYYHNIQCGKWIKMRCSMRNLAGPLWLVVLLFTLGSIPNYARAADAAFTQFTASLWPDAQKEGVSRATFERETRGLEPD